MFAQLNNRRNVARPPLRRVRNLPIRLTNCAICETTQPDGRAGKATGIAASQVFAVSLQISLSNEAVIFPTNTYECFLIATKTSIFHLQDLISGC